MPIAWEVIEGIEEEALIEGGADPSQALAVVEKAIQALKDAGVAGSKQSTWGRQGMVVPEVEEFARLLVQHVRDDAVAACDMARDPGCNSIEAKRWRRKLECGQIDCLLAEVIPDCVDKALFYLLLAVDEGLIQISFRSASGKTVDLVEGGEAEMAGRYAMGKPEGWPARFSRERFNDDLPGLG